MHKTVLSLWSCLLLSQSFIRSLKKKKKLFSWYGLEGTWNKEVENDSVTSSFCVTCPALVDGWCMD